MNPMYVLRNVNTIASTIRIFSSFRKPKQNMTNAPYNFKAHEAQRQQAGLAGTRKMTLDIRIEHDTELQLMDILDQIMVHYTENKTVTEAQLHRVINRFNETWSPKLGLRDAIVGSYTKAVRFAART